MIRLDNPEEMAEFLNKVHHYTLKMIMMDNIIDYKLELHMQIAHAENIIRDLIYPHPGVIGPEEKQNIFFNVVLKMARKKGLRPLDYIQNWLDERIPYGFDQKVGEDMIAILKEYLKDTEHQWKKGLSPKQQLRPFLTPMEEVNGL